MTLKNLRDRWAASVEALDAATRALEAPAEGADTEALARDLTTATENVAAAQAAYEQRAAVEAARTAVPAPIADLPEPTADPSPEQRAAGVQVTKAEPTYHPTSEAMFFRDVLAAEKHNDPEARERLQRNYAEVTEQLGAEYRAVATSALGSTVVPQYLLNLVAPALRAGRPFLNAISRLPLPKDGMSVYVARVTTATTVAAQATENAAFSATDIAVTDLNPSVRTFVGQNDLSVQAIERGSMSQELVFQDLAADYAAKLDASALAGAGTSGTHLGVLSTSGINAITYTDATPTVAELYPKLLDCVQQIENVQGKRANLIVMHPRRWAWLRAGTDTTTRPLIVPTAGYGNENVMGLTGDSASGDVVGTLIGIPVVTDANVPTNLGAGTNEDRIIVLDREKSHVFEDGDGTPLFLTLDQVAGPASVRLAVRGYSAFTAGRYPTSVSVISGTGLVTPTF